ncbi:hypothetical protein BGZ63DRAFT_357692 [Mariannaea sp. PMI_226]|nr:hypothetical protein BGZ63DRAFT_357692 [Mariannaea sp. PMI_226]
MSTTASTTRTQHDVLRDYNLYHSQSLSLATTSPLPTSDVPLRIVGPPDTWNARSLSHRRVPQYRPINRERDQGEVRVYTSPVERAFISVMFAGVWTNATMAKAWRRTGGRMNETYFRYPIGGEA